MLAICEFIHGFKKSNLYQLWGMVPSSCKDNKGGPTLRSPHQWVWPKRPTAHVLCHLLCPLIPSNKLFSSVWPEAACSPNEINIPNVTGASSSLSRHFINNRRQQNNLNNYSLQLWVLGFKVSTSPPYEPPCGLSKPAGKYFHMKKKLTLSSHYTIIKYRSNKKLKYKHLSTACKHYLLFSSEHQPKCALPFQSFKFIHKVKITLDKNSDLVRCKCLIWPLKTQESI